MNPARDCMGRRAFLWTAASSVLAALCGTWWPPHRASGPPAATPFAIPGAANLPTGNAVNFIVPGTEIPAVLVRLGNDRYAAFDQRCPHLGCPVLWSVERQRFECPCHRAVFDGPSGRVMSGPPSNGLRRIVIERQGEAVWTRPPHDDGDDDDDDGNDERSV